MGTTPWVCMPVLLNMTSHGVTIIGTRVGKKLLKSKRQATMLPAPKEKRHGRDLRSVHQLDPPKCRTTRHRKTTIPAVVDRLNQFFIV